jgi:hypothetical protein
MTLSAATSASPTLPPFVSVRPLPKAASAPVLNRLSSALSNTAGNGSMAATTAAAHQAPLNDPMRKRDEKARAIFEREIAHVIESFQTRTGLKAESQEAQSMRSTAKHMDVLASMAVKALAVQRLAKKGPNGQAELTLRMQAQAGSVSARVVRLCPLVLSICKSDLKTPNALPTGWQATTPGALTHDNLVQVSARSLAASVGVTNARPRKFTARFTVPAHAYGIVLDGVELNFRDFALPSPTPPSPNPTP